MTGQALFGRDMLFNLMLIANCRILTTRKHQQFNVDNSCKNSSQVRHDYAVGDIVNVEKSGIY